MLLLSYFLFHLMVLPFENVRKLDKPDGSVSYACIDLNKGLENTSRVNKKQSLEKDCILYYDDDIVAVNKPHNMQTVPGYQDPFSLAVIIQKMFKIDNIENMSPHRLGKF